MFSGSTRNMLGGCSTKSVVSKEELFHRSPRCAESWPAESSASQMASGLRMGRGEWIKRYKVAFHTDKILATNAIGGPYLLTRLTNQDIRGLLGCGPKTSLDVLQLRNDLRKSQS
jgi:hypothetical protein